MADVILLSRAQMRGLKPRFRRSPGLPRVEDWRVISGIIHLIHHLLQWKDALRGYGH
jgi:transposase